MKWTRRKTLIAGMLGLITLAIMGFRMGPAALGVGMLMALLPVPIYLSLALWLDRLAARRR